MRLRCAASGKRPMPAATLSRASSGLAVAGITHVTAAWPRMYFRTNWLQVAQSNSDTHAGSALPRTRLKSEPLSNGRLMMTATPLSAASGSSLVSAARTLME